MNGVDAADRTECVPPELGAVGYGHDAMRAFDHAPVDHGLLLVCAGGTIVRVDRVDTEEHQIDGEPPEHGDAHHGAHRDRCDGGLIPTGGSHRTR
jgi:hypothetical protein